MSDASELAGSASSTDPEVGLRAAAALRKLADSLERLQVQNARRRGWSWQDIAGALGVSKQAVHKRYAADAPAPAQPPAAAQPLAAAQPPAPAQPAGHTSPPATGAAREHQPLASPALMED